MVTSAGHVIDKLVELTDKLPVPSVLDSTDVGVKEYKVDGGCAFRFNLYKNKTISVDRWFLSGGVVYPEHFHDNQVEVIFVYEGAMELTVEGIKTIYRVGQTATIPYSKCHTALFPVDTRVITIVYPAEDYVAKVV